MTTFSRPKPRGTPTWVDLTTPDPDGARKFYHALFGWDYDISEPPWGDFRPQWQVYFGVKNADDAVATAMQQGGKPMSKVDDSPFGRLATLADSQGAFFKIVEVPAS